MRLPPSPQGPNVQSVLRRSPRLVIAFALSTAVVLGACGDDDPFGPGADAILGSWQVTSSIAGPSDLVNDGMDLDVILNTIDDDDPVDSVTFAYAITGNGGFMTWTGSIDGIPVEVALQRQ